MWRGRIAEERKGKEKIGKNFYGLSLWKRTLDNIREKVRSDQRIFSLRKEERRKRERKRGLPTVDFLLQTLRVGRNTEITGP